MFYIVAIPLILLWFHSMYLLLEKYGGKEPFWLKAYLVFGAIYFVVIPTLAIKELGEFLNLSNSINATLMGIVSLIMLFIVINKSPKH